MTSGYKVTPEMIETMKRMEKRGRTKTEIADFLGISRATVTIHLSEQSKERRRKYDAGIRAEKAETEWTKILPSPTLQSRRTEQDWQRLRAEIPKRDNRDLTGRIFGDPLPERSALAQREAGQ